MLSNNGWAGHPTFTHVPYTKSNTDDDRVSRFVRAAGTYRHCMAEKDMGLEMILRDIAIMSDEYLLGIRNIYMDVFSTLIEATNRLSGEKHGVTFGLGDVDIRQMATISAREYTTTQQWSDATGLGTMKWTDWTDRHSGTQITNALTAINNDKAYVLDSSIIDPVSDKLLYHRRIESLLVEGALPNILWAYWCPPRVERSMTYAWYSTVLSTF